MLELIGVDGLTQWDVGRQIKVDKDVDMVHFSNRPYGYSKNVKVTDGVADVPDMFLTSCAPLRVWAYVGDFEKGYTKIEKIYEVKPKNRPEDYIYTPEEIKTWEKLQDEIGDLANLETEAKENLVSAINEAAKSGGESYTLSQATAESLGGVKADPAMESDTQPVRIGGDGKLYTAPGSTDISTKMDANNPVGTGSFSMNRKSGTVVGNNSHAEGTNTTASGFSSHAEGGGTTASEPHSHAEGSLTTASGQYSHAEGGYTTASGNSSHAEGNSTIASGTNSHAEGRKTKASGDNSHAQGKFNIEDTSSIYADIIGNGTSDTARSNAATVDWNGNAWYAGDVYTGSTSGTNKDEGSKKLATEEYVNNSIVPDTTLTQSGKAADAKAVGDALAEKQSKGDYLTQDNLQSATDAALEQAKASGKFDGADGAPGKDGADGHTPVKGMDYWTASDKAEVVAEAAAAIDLTSYAKKTDIPSVLPNPNALTFTGAVTGSYDGTAPRSVKIPNAVTDDHINSLIDTKLGVIENGSY